MECYACGAEMKPVFDHSDDIAKAEAYIQSLLELKGGVGWTPAHDAALRRAMLNYSKMIEPDLQYDNALTINLAQNGYGKFIDAWGADRSAELIVTICHDCAHEACDKLPWMARLLKPQTAHSHTDEYQAEHPYHV